MVGSKSVSQESENEPKRFSISYGSIDTFDDILRFKGIQYVVDKLRKLYIMSPTAFGKLEIIINELIVKERIAISKWRKRLVGSLWDEEIYLVVRGDLEDVLETGVTIVGVRVRSVGVSVVGVSRG